jgi:RNA polymerase sigma-70 factor (ECF subfamily)
VGTLEEHDVAGDEEFLRATLPTLDLVYNLARRLVRRQADVEDLVQETYLRAWMAWTAGRPPRRVEPWLATICLNAGRDQLRRASGRLEVPSGGAGIEWDLPDTGDVEGEAIARAWRERVERAMWGLPAEQRIAIALMDLCGFTAAEVAELTGSPRGTILARVHRGRKALARLVAEQEVRDHAP